MYRVKKASSLLSFLKEKTGLSGRGIKKALENGGCHVNGKLERFGATSLKVGDAVTFRVPKEHNKEPFKILYQDNDLTFFNKPSGEGSTPLQGHYLVHRLDKGTSGVLLMARTLPMKKELEALFKKREVKKTYIALIKGTPRKEGGTIRSFLTKKGSFHGQTLYGSAPHGQEAVTHWKVLKKMKGITLVELHPETGRTHQLRVHLKEMGHPILGDLQYGREETFPIEIDRLSLHAYRLSFIHPKTGKRIQVTAPLPLLFKPQQVV
ncbi:MAG: RluA family pseudouridine synthase [Chlamydiia bacterium]|nr:RluA family pseudouridine synthase [Chlamydiia bacterium]